jgi:hypothetical protein
MTYSNDRNRDPGINRSDNTMKWVGAAIAVAVVAGVLAWGMSINAPNTASNSPTTTSAPATTTGAGGTPAAPVPR